jgi:putative oxidoreductase
MLRVAVGISAVIHGINCIRASAWITGIAELAAGILLVIGLLTPLAGFVVAIGAAEVAFSRFSISVTNIIEARWMNVSLIVIAAAIIFMGPGAFSIDSLLFGRKKIVIPTRRSP